MAAGTVYIDGRFRNDEGQVLVMGRVLVGNNDIIRPQDVGMKRIKSITFTPWASTPNALVPGSIGSLVGKNYTRFQDRKAVVMTGSIGSLNNLDVSTAAATPGGNYVRVRSYTLRTYGTWAEAARTMMGTQAGSIRASFIAAGV